MRPETHGSSRRFRRPTTLRAASVLAVLIVAATSARAQQPGDTTRRPSADTTRPAQNIQGVRIEAAPRPLTEMEFRLRVSGGHLVSKADIAQSGAGVWVDAVRLVPGVQVLITPMRAGSPMQLRRLSMRGASGRCTPPVYLNGLLQTMAEFDWENFVTLESIERIEVYSAANVPLQFRPTGSSCGSVLIWTTKDR